MSIIEINTSSDNQVQQYMYVYMNQPVTEVVSMLLAAEYTFGLC